MPELKSIDQIKTAPFDPRFPNQNQTRNCYQNFLDFHRCSKVRGEDYEACQYFKRIYLTLCPSEWHEKWTEQIEEERAKGVEDYLAKRNSRLCRVDKRAVERAMAAFQAIQSYGGSDSENDEAPNESRNINETAEKPEARAQPATLPLPDSISKFIGVPHHEEVVDNPADHQGRTRSFKHERGNWATHIYAPYKPSGAVKLWMKDIQWDITWLHPHYHLHMSLTRTVVLKHHWIESFLESLKKLFQETKRFVIELQDVKVYKNDNELTTFVAIRCACVDDSLKKLVEALNKLLAEYQLPPYYEDASFHISCLSSISDMVSLLEVFEENFSNNLARLLKHTSPYEGRVTIDHLHCKIGNRVYEFPLK